MKKIITASLIAVMLLCCVSCGGNGKTSESPDASVSESVSESVSASESRSASPFIELDEIPD